MSAEFVHRPVMGREVVDLLSPVPPGTVIDATAGGGGHAGLLLDARPDLRLLGIDRDPVAVAAASTALARFGERARIVHGGFEHLAEIAATESEGNIVGVLFDLGVSSPQLDRAERGFSYWSDAPLDMRMDSDQTLTAADVVNNYDEAELVAHHPAQRRGAVRPPHRARDRRGVARWRRPASSSTPSRPRSPRRRAARGGHPARRTFQAIRMEVNRELPNLAEGLGDSVHLLTPGGRVLVLAYHSLEDRLVKQQFAEWAGEPPRGRAHPARTSRAQGPAPIVRLLTRDRCGPVTTSSRRTRVRPACACRAAERLSS